MDSLIGWASANKEKKTLIYEENNPFNLPCCHGNGVVQQ
jgi:hypothetical protein